jgi:hypothetical protein
MCNCWYCQAQSRKEFRFSFDFLHTQEPPRIVANEYPIENAGRKNDDGKLRYDLIPPRALEALAYVYTIGAKKYGDYNWHKGMSWGRIISAMFRHIAAWLMGCSKDPHDGQHPLASVAWCAFTLMEYERLGLGEDTRRS